MCKRQQDRRLMKKVLVKHNLLVIEKTDLRRCRTGINHQYLHFTARSVASFSKCKRPRFFLRGRHSRFIPLTQSSDPAARSRKKKPKDDKDKIVHLLH